MWILVDGNKYEYPFRDLLKQDTVSTIVTNIRKYLNQSQNKKILDISAVYVKGKRVALNLPFPKKIIPNEIQIATYEFNNIISSNLGHFCIFTQVRRGSTIRIMYHAKKTFVPFKDASDYAANSNDKILVDFVKTEKSSETNRVTKELENNNRYKFDGLMQIFQKNMFVIRQTLYGPQIYKIKDVAYSQDFSSFQLTLTHVILNGEKYCWEDVIITFPKFTRPRFWSRLGLDLLNTETNQELITKLETLSGFISNTVSEVFQYTGNLSLYDGFFSPKLKDVEREYVLLTAPPFPMVENPDLEEAIDGTYPKYLISPLRMAFLLSENCWVQITAMNLKVLNYDQTSFYQVHHYEKEDIVQKLQNSFATLLNFTLLIQCKKFEHVLSFCYKSCNAPWIIDSSFVTDSAAMMEVLEFAKQHHLIPVFRNGDDVYYSYDSWKILKTYRGPVILYINIDINISSHLRNACTHVLELESNVKQGYYDHFY